MANSVAPSYAYPTMEDVVRWQREMLERLDQWEIAIPQRERHDTYIEIISQIRCRTIKMLLLRPSPAIPTPPVEMIMVCYTTAQQTIKLYEHLYRQDLIIYDWITLHGIVLATITMMYCLRTAKNLAQNTEAEDFIGDISISLSVLSATGEHWASAKRSREVLDDLARSTLSWLKLVKTTAGNIVDASQDSAIGGSDVLPALPNSLNCATEVQTFESLWSATNAQDIFSDTTNVDDIMRSLFDGFLPQGDSFDFLQDI